MKTVSEWLSELPDGYRERALMNRDSANAGYKTGSMSSAISHAFTWRKSPEGQKFWLKVQRSFYDNGGVNLPPLPPLPDAEPELPWRILGPNEVIAAGDQLSEAGAPWKEEWRTESISIGLTVSDYGGFLKFRTKRPLPAEAKPEVTPDKFAALKEAHARGEKIEWMTHGEWRPCPSPIWYDGIQYRIAPAPPQPAPVEYKMTASTGIFTTPYSIEELKELKIKLAPKDTPLTPTPEQTSTMASTQASTSTARQPQVGDYYITADGKGRVLASDHNGVVLVDGIFRKKTHIRSIGWDSVNPVRIVTRRDLRRCIKEPVAVMGYAPPQPKQSILWRMAKWTGKTAAIYTLGVLTAPLAWVAGRTAVAFVAYWIGKLLTAQ
jgi:hypothetical protein